MENKSDEKGCAVIFLIAFFLLYYIGTISSFIFPVMDDDEYFIEHKKSKEDISWDVIHNNCCPRCEVPWFTRKHSKYRVIIEKSWSFCTECFSKDDVEIMIFISDINLESLTRKYEHSKYTQRYTDSVLSIYEYYPTVNELLYGE